jgi:hypothetical protein
MTERRHDHGAVVASIGRAEGPCRGSTGVSIVAPGAFWRVEFVGNGVRTSARNEAGGPKAPVALRAPSASGPPASSDSSTTPQTATTRPTTKTEQRPVVGAAPLLTLRRQK